MFEEQGKISRVPKIVEKPDKDDYRLFASEAKKNLVDRYYYEKNLDQWKII